jgi:hypothetical protein
VFISLYNVVVLELRNDRKHCKTPIPEVVAEDATKLRCGEAKKMKLMT